MAGMPVPAHGRKLPAGHSGSDNDAEFVVQGIAASAGTYTGPVRVVLSVDDLHTLLEGEVLVVRASNPAWTVGMLKCGALVAELGGPICHAAIVARELGIPCVVAVQQATAVIPTGAIATVNGNSGFVKVRA